MAQEEAFKTMAKSLEKQLTNLTELTASQISPQAAKVFNSATKGFTQKMLKNATIQSSDYEEGTFAVQGSQINGYRYHVLLVMNPKKFAQEVESQVKNQDVKLAAQLHDTLMGKLEAATQAYEADKAAE